MEWTTKGVQMSPVKGSKQPQEKRENRNANVPGLMSNLV